MTSSFVMFSSVYLLKRENYPLDVHGISIINLDGVGNLKYPLFLIRDLKIPYLVIVDKDFFIPYLHDQLKESRNNEGFPKYRYEYKDDCLIDNLVPNVKNRNQQFNGGTFSGLSFNSGFTFFPLYI